MKKQNRFLATQRTSGVSTSGLITRIVKDYDIYVRRNLSRGVSPKDLNISYLKEKELTVKNSVKEFTDKIHQKFKEGEGVIKNNWSASKEDLILAVKNWEEKSHQFAVSFASLFDPIVALLDFIGKYFEKKANKGHGKLERVRIKK